MRYLSLLSDEIGSRLTGSKGAWPLTTGSTLQTVMAPDVCPHGPCPSSQQLAVIR